MNRSIEIVHAISRMMVIDSIYLCVNWILLTPFRAYSFWISSHPSLYTKQFHFQHVCRSIQIECAIETWIAPLISCELRCIDIIHIHKIIARRSDMMCINELHILMLFIDLESHQATNRYCSFSAARWIFQRLTFYQFEMHASQVCRNRYIRIVIFNRKLIGIKWFEKHLLRVVMWIWLIYNNIIWMKVL